MAYGIQLWDSHSHPGTKGPVSYWKPFSPTGLGGRQGVGSDFKYLDLCAQAMNEIKLEIVSIGKF